MAKQLVTQDKLVNGITDIGVFIEAIQKSFNYNEFITKDRFNTIIEASIRAGIAFGKKGGESDKGTEAGTRPESS